MTKNINVTEAKDVVKNIFNNKSTRLIPLLVGGAGVGKTQLVEQVAKELNLSLAYVNLADRQPGEFAVNFVTSDDALGTAIDSVFDADIVFFDELNRAELVMSEVMNIMQSKTIRGVPLECKFICAMNLGSSYSVSDLDPAQWGRFVRIDVKPDMGDWSRYIQNKYHTDNPTFKSKVSQDTLTTVLSFIRHNNVLQSDDDMLTPRTWDELLCLGVMAFAPYLLPTNTASELKAYFEKQRYPSYANASKENWVPVAAEYDYVLGALDESLATIIKLLMCLSIDSVGLVLAEIATRKPVLHTKIMRDEVFMTYVKNEL